MAEQNEKKDSFFHTAGPALLSGAAQAVLFNPFDRALYVRVKFRRRHFLDRRNFHHPFQGFMNAAVYRTLVGASYLFWQDSVRIFIEEDGPDFLQASHSPGLNAFVIGMVAGSLNGAALNGMQVVKYRMWNMEGEAVFCKVVRQAYRENGVCIFFRGIGVTILRDCVFGVVYELCRRARFVTDVFYPYVKLTEQRVSFCCRLLLSSSDSLPVANSEASDSHDVSDGPAPSCRRDECSTCVFISNLLAALVASVMSSPFNYVRSIVYSCPSGTVPMRSFALLRFFLYQVRFIYRHGESFTDANTPFAVAAQCGAPSRFAASKLWRRVRGEMSARAVCRNRHPIAAWRWANSRLNIGWGSVRVGLGMAVGQSLFYMLQEI